MRVAAVQWKPEWGKVAQNRERLLSLMHEVIAEQAQVIVLPEMCTTGYVFHSRDEILPLCEKNDGESFVEFSAFCKTNGVYLIYGFAEKAGNALYNSQNVIDPTGKLIATYRKTHLYEQDTYWALPGDTGFMSIDTPIGRLGLGICMDMNFDDFIEFHIERQTDLIAFSACWLDEGFPIAPYWYYRLTGYRGTICIANSFGEERGVRFRGESCIFAGEKLVARASLDCRQILIAENSRSA